MEKQKGFTLIELLIVISIIAILAATIIPNFVGFDTEARVAASKTNLDALRTRITLFRAKQGEYPVRLEQLVETRYDDMGVQKPYLLKMPPEMISDKVGNASVQNLTSNEEPLVRNGGWVYYSDKAEVHLNIEKTLEKKWGGYEGQRPADW